MRNSRNPVSYKIVNGIKADWISIRLLANIFTLALSRKKNPIEAIRIFREVEKKRAKIQGFRKIPRFLKNGKKYHFAEQIPGWPSKAFERFFDAELLRIENTLNQRHPLNTIIFAITSRCPLQCVHCYEWDNIDSKEHLNLTELNTILEKLKSLGLTHLQFGGGEPLARFDDLLSLIEKAKPQMDCWILTSGFGLTPEKARQLKQAGLTGASISLDHWDEKAHNDFRKNENSFNWVREAAKNCREAGIIVSLAICATREFVSKNNIKKYLELAKEWQAGFIRILEPRQTGRFKGKNVVLEPEQVDILMEFYQETYSDNFYRKHPIVMFPGFDQRQVGCLGAGNRYMYIDSKGDIHACPFCQNPVGNALSDSLEEAIVKLKKNGCQVFELST